jgi:hypothetical protein
MNEAERSTAVDRPDGNVSGIVKRFSKDSPASETPLSLGLIKKIYSEAIEYTAIAKGTRGMIMFVGLFGSGLVIWCACDGFMTQLSSRFLGAAEFFFVFLSTVLILCSSYLALKCMQLELFMPEDSPIIFDRRNRKVYRIYKETYTGWRGVLRHWPLRTAEHDWALIDAEHQATVSTTGSTILRYHALMFLVRKSSSDPTIVDSFTVGSSIQMGEVTVPAVWEHIRRFMEEDGPHLNPGEVVHSSVPSESFWKCMAATGPYGANFKIWWKKYTLLMLWGYFFSPSVGRALLF